MRLSNDELDRAIDDVAREMVSAESATDLRARVVARLLDGRSPARAVGPRLAWGSAVALVAVVTIAVLLMRPAMESPAPAPTRLAASDTAEPPVIEPGQPGPASDTRATMRVPERRRVRRADTASPGLAWDAGPAPLPHPEPIAIDTLAPAALTVPGFDVAPLDDIQPITIPAAGPGLPDQQRREPR